MEELHIETSGDVTITGVAPSLLLEQVTNVGRGRVTLVSATGERLVLEPGESGRLQLPKGAFRLACPDCGLHTGAHETWCPAWEPY